MTTLTVEQAQDLADRTLARIDAHDWTVSANRLAADRERVASDVAGLIRHQSCGVARHGLWATTCIASDPCDDLAAFSDGLIRTARLYGVTP